MKNFLKYLLIISGIILVLLAIMPKENKDNPPTITTPVLYDLEIQETNCIIKVMQGDIEIEPGQDVLTEGVEYTITIAELEPYMLYNVVVNDNIHYFNLDNFRNGQTIKCDGDLIIEAEAKGVKLVDINFVMENAHLSIFDNDLQYFRTGLDGNVDTSTLLFVDTNYSLSVTPKTGYKITSATINGVNVLDSSYDLVFSESSSSPFNIEVVVSTELIDDEPSSPEVPPIEDLTFDLTQEVSNADVVVTLFGSDIVVSPGEDVLNKGYQVQITATPHNGYILDDFLINGSNSHFNGCVITVTENLNIQATAVERTDENCFDMNLTIENAKLRVVDGIHETLVRAPIYTNTYDNVGIINHQYKFIFIPNDGYELTVTRIVGELSDVCESFSTFITSDLTVIVKAIKSTTPASYFTFDGATLTGFSDEGQAKYNAGQLYDLLLPTKSSDNVVVTAVGDDAFRGCDLLKSVIVPSGYMSIGQMAFIGCISLESIEIPHSVSTVGVGAFQNCRSLTNVILPSSITEIPASLFQVCTALKSITFGGSITSIDSNAFKGCYNCVEFNFTASTQVPILSTNAFEGLSANAKIVVVDFLYDSWIIAEDWSAYASQIVKASDFVA